MTTRTTKAARASTAPTLFISGNRVEYAIASGSDPDDLRNDADFFFGSALKLLRDLAYEIDDDRAAIIVTLLEMSDGARHAAEANRRAEGGEE